MHVPVSNRVTRHVNECCEFPQGSVSSYLSQARRPDLCDFHHRLLEQGIIVGNRGTSLRVDPPSDRYCRNDREIYQHRLRHLTTHIMKPKIGKAPIGYNTVNIFVIVKEMLQSSSNSLRRSLARMKEVMFEPRIEKGS